jgi:hypothetical protein
LLATKQIIGSLEEDADLLFGFARRLDDLLRPGLAVGDTSGCLLRPPVCETGTLVAIRSTKTALAR